MQQTMAIFFLRKAQSVEPTIITSQPHGFYSLVLQTWGFLPQKILISQIYLFCYDFDDPSPDVPMRAEKNDSVDA